VSGLLILSDRIASLEQGLRLPKKTTFQEISVVGPDAKQIGQAVAVLFEEHLDAIDVGASECEMLTETMPWYFTGPPVVRSSALVDFDLASCIHVTRLCSEDMRDVLTKANATNIRFKECISQTE